ncbi:MAG TPA: hypothetical protein VER03_15605 [Bryobacteraceae bacterium]|nr:hypothetical protein [Bryobacteraceae bacterium]
MNGYLSWSGAELDATVWQGIEFLSMDTGVPGYAAVVTVHLARPASGMSAESVQVTGGRRIVLPNPEVVLINGVDTFEVRFAVKGDHSAYSIRLLNGGDDPLNPFFAQADFRFYIDCETGDCRPSALLPLIEPAQPPSIDTRYKDFNGFMRMLSEWVRVANPDWADLAPASQERMLMELLAHQGDMLSYYQDRVANEAFLATASQRHSLRQHATLLGYPVFDGAAAQTTLAFETTVAGFVPAGLSVENRRLHGERPVVFYVRDRTRVDPSNNTSVLTVAAWPGASSATVAAGSTTLLLWDQTYSLLAGMRFAFAQGDYTHTATLTSVRPIDLPGWAAFPTDPLVPADRPLTEIQFEPPLARELRPWDAAAPLRMYANLASASHGARRVTWINPPPAPAPGDPVPSPEDIVLPLNQRNAIVVAVPRGATMVSLLRAFQVPEGPVVYDGDNPVIDVYIDGELWSREEHLHQSQSFDLHYAAGSDNSGHLWLEFGDGVRGREIEVDPVTWLPTVSMRIVYRIGEPLDGNCARDTLTEVVQPAEAGFAGLGVTAITNITPGLGGKRKDTLDEIREGVPNSLRHGELQRAVSLADYAAIAKEVEGVSRAAAKALGGPFNTVLVLIDADDETQLTAELSDRVWQRIEETRMAGREHFVAPADYVPLRVELIICVQPGFLRHLVRERVLAELRPGTDEQSGYFHPDNLTFGQDLEAGDLVAFVQSIPGVRSVKVLAFCRLSQPVPTVEDRIIFGATEVARLDADEDFPENGVMEVSVVGLDHVDESLFDIEEAV